MMIELKEEDYKLIKGVEEANATNYGIVEVRGNYYIDKDDLLAMIDDIQYNRNYAEEKLQEVVEDYEERLKDKTPQIFDFKVLKEELNNLKQEKVELEAKIEAIQNTLDEDDYDRLAREGIEF